MTASHQGLIVEYGLTPQDLIAFRRFTYLHSPSHRRERRIRWLKWFLWCFIPFGAFLVFGYSYEGHLDLPHLASSLALSTLSGVIGLGISAGIFRYQLRAEVRRVVRDGSHLFQTNRRRVEILPESLKVELRGPSGITGNSDVPWSSIVNIGISRDGVYAYVSPRDAIVIPRRAFADAEFERFVTAMLEYQDDVHAAAA